jgi:alanine racemase
MNDFLNIWADDDDNPIRVRSSRVETDTTDSTSGVGGFRSEWDGLTLEQRCSRAWVEINLAAIGENVTQIRAKLQPTTAMMAIVKADGYGHGAAPVARAALKAGATWLGVATVWEGVALRQAGITAPILVLEAISDRDRAITAREYDLDLTVAFPKQAVALSELFAGSEIPLPVHLNIDTGMSRLGVNWTQAESFFRLLRCLPGLHLKTIYSHLATADEPDTRMVQTQHQRFETVLTRLREMGWDQPIHLSNSAGAIAFPKLHYDMVRVGLALYGIAPAPHLADQITLRPAMSVRAKVTQIQTLPPDRGVSYGHRFISDRETRLATVGIGYADGVPRLLSGRLWVAIGGQLAPQVGTITMDQLMVDVTDLTAIEVGDTVTLIGDDGDHRLTAQQWAETIGTIPWEIVCGFRQRLPRLYVSSPDPIEPMTPNTIDQGDDAKTPHTVREDSGS